MRTGEVDAGHGGSLARIVALVAINVLIFYFLIRWCNENINWDVLAQRLGRVSAAAVIWTAAANLIAVCFYGLRLGVLLARRFGVALSATFLGLGLNSILPFRLGELTKLYYASSILHVPVSSLAAATIVEKLFDLSALAVLGAFVLVFANIGFIPEGMVVGLIAVVICGFAAILLYRRVSHRLDWLARRSARMNAVVVALHEQSRLHHLHKIVGYTAVVWVLNTAVMYVGVSNLLPGHSFNGLDAIAMLLISALAIAIPAAPAGLGVFEAGIVAYLTQVRGVPNEPALAAAVVLHLAITVPLVVALGCVMVRWRVYSRKSLERQ